MHVFNGPDGATFFVSPVLMFGALYVGAFAWIAWRVVRKALDKADGK